MGTTMDQSLDDLRNTLIVMEPEDLTTMMLLQDSDEMITQFLDAEDKADVYEMCGEFIDAVYENVKRDPTKHEYFTARAHYTLGKLKGLLKTDGQRKRAVLQLAKQCPEKAKAE